MHLAQGKMNSRTNPYPQHDAMADQNVALRKLGEPTNEGGLQNLGLRANGRGSIIRVWNPYSAAGNLRGGARYRIRA